MILLQSLKKSYVMKKRDRDGKEKTNNKYYFSVEGETEQWYLKWLQDTINNTEKAACKVSIDCPVRKNPLKHAKSLTVTRKIEIYHFFDYESDEPLHVKGFQEALDNMKKAEKIGKQIGVQVRLQEENVCPVVYVGSFFNEIRLGNLLRK